MVTDNHTRASLHDFSVTWMKFGRLYDLDDTMFCAKNDINQFRDIFSAGHKALFYTFTMLLIMQCNALLLYKQVIYCYKLFSYCP